VDGVVDLIIAFSKKAAGLGIAAVPLLLIFPLMTASLQGLGKLGGVITGFKGEGLRKKAEGYAKYNQDRRAANALAGRSTIGGGRYRRRTRRELRNQAAETAAKSGQAQFGVADDKAKEYTQAISQSNAQISAINAANNTAFATGVAKGEIDVREGMHPKAAGDDEVKKAINAQQERAVAEAIKDVELSANFKPGDVASIAAAMEAAIKGGDGIGARAYQNMLMRSGGPGTEAYRNAMTDIKGGDLADPKVAGAMESVKRNLLINHGSVKETAADLIKHASDQGKKDTAGNVIAPPRTMEEVTNDPKSWKMSNEDLVKQKTHSLKQAVAAGGILPEQAREIQKDDQLYRRLDQGGREAIDKAAQTATPGQLDIAHDEALRENTRRGGGGTGTGGASPYL
jgi:hypothetical protein